MNNSYFPGKPENFWPVAASDALRAAVQENTKAICTKSDQQNYQLYIDKLDSLLNQLVNLTNAINPPLAVVISDQFITLSSGTDSLLTVPSQANYAVLQSIGCDTVHRVTGQSPAANGYKQLNGAVWDLSSHDQLTKLRIRAAANQSGTLVITYFNK